MSANLNSAAPTGRKKIAQGKDSAYADDAALGHESKTREALKGRKKPAGRLFLCPRCNGCKPT